VLSIFVSHHSSAFLRVHIIKTKFVYRLKGVSQQEDKVWIIKENLNYLQHGKAIPVTSHRGPQGCETSRLQHFLDNRLTYGGNIVSLMCLLPFTPRKIHGTHFCYRLQVDAYIGTHVEQASLLRLSVPTVNPTMKKHEEPERSFVHCEHSSKQWKSLKCLPLEELESVQAA
jgi:hypothetical protein